MAKILTALKDELQQGFLNLLGLLTALGQLALLVKLFSDETNTNTVYAASIALCCAMLFLFIRSRLKVRKLAPRSQKRKIHKALSIVYAACALIALVPGGYRWWYIHYPHEPGEEPSEPVIGALVGAMIVNVHAAELQGVLELNMSLDSLRTSFQCSRIRNDRKERTDTFNVNDCAEYAIPSYRFDQLMNGHGLDESAAGTRAANAIDSRMMASAFRALERISIYRKKHEPYLDRGSIIMFLFAQNPNWKKTLLAAGLLPNAAEWELLTKEYPDESLALRKFVIEWVGFVDPFFRLSFRNTTSIPIEVSMIRYTADPRRGVVAGQTTLIGSADTPRYRIELDKGAHETELQPHVIVPPNGIKEIDLLLLLKQPDPYITYDITFEFLSRRDGYQVKLPPFAVTFARNR